MPGDDEEIPVNWETVSRVLTLCAVEAERWSVVDVAANATGSGPEGKAARDKLFANFDPNGNGRLSLSEAHAGMATLLSKSATQRGRGEATVPLIPVAGDKKKFLFAVRTAFKASCSLLPDESDEADAFIDRRHFHAFLVHFRYHIEMLELFKDVDDTGQIQLSFDKFKAVMPDWESWHIPADQLQRKLGKGDFNSGSIDFDDFAEWCTSFRFREMAATFDVVEAPKIRKPRAKSLADWDAIDPRIPIARGEDGRAARDALFRRFDVNGNRSLSLTEAQANFTSLLKRERAKGAGRQRGERSEELLPQITDIRPAVKSSFHASQDLLKAKGYRKSGGDANIDRMEFHALLIYFRHYLELLVLFKELDKSEDARLGFEECMLAQPYLEHWCITEKHIRDKFGQAPSSPSGAKPKKDVKFDDFADWCLDHALDEAAFEGLDPEPEKPAKKVAVITPKNPAGPVVESGPADALLSPVSPQAKSGAEMRAELRAKEEMERTMTVRYKSPHAKIADYTGHPVQGVNQSRAHMKHLGHIQSAPRFSIAERTGEKAALRRSSSTPAPGSYRHEAPMTSGQSHGFSFGAMDRFQRGDPPWRKKPGPGDHDPKETLKFPKQQRCGFGGAPRGGRGIAAHGPGPGAYEVRGAFYDTPMFTQTGRMPEAYQSADAAPGPGSYLASTSLSAPSAVKVGFGTATRGKMFMDVAVPGPGPGAYDLHKYRTMGSEARKFSLIAKRRSGGHFGSHLSPGPGQYNTDYSSFEG